jgi:hypothetical protein
VAVNVWPSLVLVGVKVAQRQDPDGYGGDSFVYPVRSGTDADYLEPSELAMYMTPKVRRTVVLLSRVPGDAVVEIQTLKATPAGPRTGSHEFAAILVEVREDENIVTFKGTDGQEMRRIPLDCILTVFEDWDSNSRRYLWRMIVAYD